MYGIRPSETKIMKDLVKELNELNSFVRSGASPFGRDYIQGNYFYAFNPCVGTSKEHYEKNIRLQRAVDDMLSRNCIDIKSRGYTYLKDAICIVIDKRSMDICMASDIYPYIVDKHSLKNIGIVEHNIRNSLESAYKKCTSTYPERECIMNKYGEKPTNKKFILMAVREISEKVLNEYMYD